MMPIATTRQRIITHPLAYGCFLSVTLIIVRLFYLQVHYATQFKTKSQQNYTRYERIQCPRGDILDCHGNVLVTNTPITHLYWYGTGNRHLSTQQEATLATLAQLVDDIDLNEHLVQQIRTAERRNTKTMLIKNISIEMLSMIEEHFAHEANLHIETDFKRYYPYNTLASHAIGYLGNIRFEPSGKMGLEKLFDSDLQGNEGTVRKVINSYGKCIHVEPIKERVKGATITTTLDLHLQQLAENTFGQEHTGTFILMDPNTGALKAFVSRPSFDPNLFTSPLRPQEWQELQKNRPFLNRAIHCSYPPGSLFKLITISAALETGLITQDTMHNCKGYYLFGGRKYWCARRYGHGDITPLQGLALSCNSLFYELGTQLPIDTLADYAHRFGLGKPTGFLLHEKTGLVPSRSWKEQEKGERWWPGETLSAAIGQSFLLATPLQIARMMSAVCTGELVKPRLLATEPIEREPLAIAPETLAFLRDSMRSVVTQGTGRRMNRIDDITIYAKTSTAQTSKMQKRNLGKHYFEHGWMMAHFRYKDEDPLIMVVLVEHAGTSRVPVMIAKEFLIAYRNSFRTQQS